MSKFFKALEQAERDRALQEQLGPDTGNPAAVEHEVPAPSAAEVARGTPAPAGQPVPAVTPTPGRTIEDPAPTIPSRRVSAVLETPPLGDRADVVGVETHLVSLHQPASLAAEQYRNLRHIIEHDASLQLVAVTSPRLGDGKTTSATNLAGSLAQSPGARVILIDADLRRPEVARFMGIAARHGKGLVDLLADSRLPFEAAVAQCEPYNLAVMPAGEPPPNPYELLKSPRLEWVLNEARHRYHFVILDTPPVVPLPDCRLLGTKVDGFVIIVAADRTPRRFLQESLETLEGTKIVGMVFNQEERATFDYEPYYVPTPVETTRGFRRVMERMTARSSRKRARDPHV
jgi:capsular exopolysaccharide synthesis family protein